MMHKSLMPSNYGCVTNKWVFKIKYNGVYWACLVECRYSQILGVNFSKNYSLVADDVMFYILFLIVICFGFLASIVYDETAFLCKDLEEEICMEFPQRMSGI